MVEGKMSFDSARKTWKIVFYNEKKKADSTLYCRDKSQFSGNLTLDESLEIEVEFERLPNGDPIKIRPKGQAWQGQETAQRHGDRSRRDFQNQPRNNFSQSLKGEFYNPYNFVPAVPRGDLVNGLEDSKPIGHDKYHEGYYSGKLTVKMTAETPLAIMDTARMKIDGNDHKSFPVRIENGKPFINPTAVKGMLRSAFEAVTDSRMSVFVKHEERLAFRSEAKLGAVPARVIKKEDGNLYYRVMRSHLLRLGFAAKLKRYKVGDNLDKTKGAKFVAKTYNDWEYSEENLPKHQEPVWVQLNSKGAVDFITRRNIGEAKAGLQAGWVCVTGANINGKRNERVFLESAKDRLIKIEKKHRELWNELIGNYQEIHQKDLADRAKKNQRPSDYLGKNPGETAWSRHIYDKNYKDLTEGTLCYLNFKRNSETEIDAVIPVTISRRLFEVSPAELLSGKLKPAKLITQLSPADRVFGWVRQSKPKDNELNSAEKELPKKIKNIGAYRGQIRIGSIICQTEKENAIQEFDESLTLNILGQPKPQQGRFYVSETPKTSESQIEKRSNEDAGYKVGRGLRGRKVYPHHANLPNDYWTNQNGLHEYLRPYGEKDSQNRSIEGWVKPQTIFEFDIHFTNLSKVEFGALVWLLSLNSENENKYFHRFGGGKPYGFGSVKLEITASDVRDGKDWKTFYMSFDDEKKGKLEKVNLDELREEFYELTKSEFPNVIKSFHRACEGFADKPTHYPRKRKEPNSDDKSFEWFVSNSKIERGTIKHGYVLQDLADDEGLPYLE